MGRKKSHLVTLKPFCYYCDKEFNNELILHQHQKARHFNCAKCKKRFSTAPALETHELQVHRSSLKRVPNAKAGRDTFDISIYAMDGVPNELINYKLEEKIEQKKKKLILDKKIIGNIKEEHYLNKKDKREQKEKDIRDLLKKSGGNGFYHNPDSINLTLKQNQMNCMYINKQSSIKESEKKDIIIKPKKEKEDVKEGETKNLMTLEQFNKELD